MLPSIVKLNRKGTARLQYTNTEAGTQANDEAQASSSHESVSTSYKRRRLSDYLVISKRDRNHLQNMITQPANNTTARNMPSPSLDKGKTVAVERIRESPIPTLQIEYIEISPEPETKMEEGLPDNIISEPLPTQGDIPNVITETSQPLTGAAVSAFIGPETIDRHFLGFLLANRPTSDFKIGRIPIPPTNLVVDEPIWNSSRGLAIQAAQDPYLHKCVLSGTDLSEPILLYPFSASEIPDEHADAFGGIIDILQANIYRYGRSHDAEIQYELWMCGTSKDTAQPSIVVICKKDNLKDIESVLTRPEVLSLCNIIPPALERETWSELRWYRSQIPDQNVGRSPKFKIYFCPRDTNPAFKVQAEVEQVDAETSVFLFNNNYGFLWSGSTVVVGENAISTIACFLRIGTETFGLTTAHGYNGLPHSRLLLHVDQASSDLAAVKLASEPLKSFFQVPCNILLPLAAQKNPTTSDLDWALIRVPQRYLPAKSISVVFPVKMGENLGSVASFARPRSTREVIILSSVKSRTKTGMLLPGITFQTVSCNSYKVGLWSVAPLPGHEIIPGDSGSLVVDSVTHMAYGYIVSVNTFAFAQIVPLSGAIDQLRSTFEGEDVQLRTWTQADDLESGVQDSLDYSSEYLKKSYHNHSHDVKSEDQSEDLSEEESIGQSIIDIDEQSEDESKEWLERDTGGRLE